MDESNLRSDSLSGSEEEQMAAPSKKQPFLIDPGQAQLRVPTTDSESPTFLLYVGTDGSADWIRRCQASAFGERTRVNWYDGDAPNVQHSFEHRKKHHGPQFYREVREAYAVAVAEWWVRFDAASFEEDELQRGTDYKTVVHYAKHDRFLAGVLSALKTLHADVTTSWAPAISPPIELQDDLQDASLGHEIVIESVFPTEFDPSSKHTNIGGAWSRAAKQALYVQREAARILTS